MKNTKFIAVELQAHLVDLLDTNSVLARDGAALFKTEHQDFTAKCLCSCQLIAVIRIVKNQRMQIAISGMKHIGDL